MPVWVVRRVGNLDGLLDPITPYRCSSGADKVERPILEDIHQPLAQPKTLFREGSSLETCRICLAPSSRHPPAGASLDHRPVFTSRRTRQAA